MAIDEDDNETVELGPLLESPGEDEEHCNDVEVTVPSKLSRRLYLSHFLSTWNSRIFEFGAVLYLAAIYPAILRPMSVYAFARSLSAIIFAPAIGQYIDVGNRLHVVRVSIGEPLFSERAFLILIERSSASAPCGSCFLRHVLPLD